MPFYVSPEQVMKDRADYARKGIARGRSLVAMEYADGIALVAENPSGTLHKLSEVYDRIAFAGVGKYNEFEMLKIAGIRHADVRGYSYSREDVSARALANGYAQTLGQVFTHEMKPYEVEILVAQVGEHEGEANEMFHILYDGTVMDEHGFSVLGGQAEAISDALKADYSEGLDVGGAIRLSTKALGSPDDRQIEADQLEVAVLDRTRPRRKFRRIDDEEVAALLVNAYSREATWARGMSPSSTMAASTSQRARSPQGLDGRSRCGGRSSTESTSLISMTSLASSRSCSGT
jgi:proteasome alpha subunit